VWDNPRCAIGVASIDAVQRRGDREAIHLPGSAGDNIVHDIRPPLHSDTLEDGDERVHNVVEMYHPVRRWVGVPVVEALQAQRGVAVAAVPYGR
jgi:hypothetical protein